MLTMAFQLISSSFNNNSQIPLLPVKGATLDDCTQKENEEMKRSDPYFNCSAPRSLFSDVSSTINVIAPRIEDHRSTYRASPDFGASSRYFPPPPPPPAPPHDNWGSSLMMGGPGSELPPPPRPAPPPPAPLLPSSSSNGRGNGSQMELCVFLLNQCALALEVDDPHITAGQIMDLIMDEDKDLLLPPQAKDVFALWIGSSLLELQLKPSHEPIALRAAWGKLLDKYVKPSPKQLDLDDPILTLQRNVFFDKHEEARLDCTKVLDLLYHEAKLNVLDGKYPCEQDLCETLASIQARIELGPFNQDVHTPEFFRKNLHNYLPAYALSSVGWPASIIPGLAPKSGPEHRVLEKFQYLSVPTPEFRLKRKYLEHCWNFPFYGSAMFPGQVEQSVHGLATLFNHPDIKVLVAINKEGVHIINQKEACVMLSLRYKDFSCNYVPSSRPQSPSCLPYLFILFRPPSNSSAKSSSLPSQQHIKLLQIFSHQAFLMDHLIKNFDEEAKKRPEPQGDHHLSLEEESSYNSRRTINGLASKLDRISQATFNGQADFINSTGSWVPISGK